MGRKRLNAKKDISNSTNLKTPENSVIHNCEKANNQFLPIKPQEIRDAIFEFPVKNEYVNSIVVLKKNYFKFKNIFRTFSNTKKVKKLKNNIGPMMKTKFYMN